MSYTKLLHRVWSGSISLQINLAPDDCRTYDQSFPYFIQFPRLSYLPLLLPRLRSFFAPALIDSSTPAHQGWFSYDGVPLKWQHPVGLLYDLFSGAEPTGPDDGRAESGEQSAPDSHHSHRPLCRWELSVHFTDWPAEHLIRLDAAGKVQHDAFINSVKEADFLRNGTAKVMMSLSKDDSTKLWQSVQNHDLALFDVVYQKFLNPPGVASLRHVPIKVYLPATSSMPKLGQQSSDKQARGSLKVVQKLVTPMLTSKEPQTIGSALRDMLPSVFPSRRAYIHAQAVLHGAILPPSTPVHDLMRGAAYADGFLHIAVVMVS